MQKKIIIVLLAATAGVGVGALLGYGPMLRYKSEGVLNMDMGTSEYKRFTELANDANSASQFLVAFPPEKIHNVSVDALMSAIVKGEWHKALPKISKVDAKEIPEAILQMERDADKDKEKAKEKSQSKSSVKSLKESTVYLGLRLTHTASNPLEAAETTTWLGGYFKEVATREAVREQVSRWKADNRQFSDRALEQKLKYEFEIEQSKNRALALKKIVVKYPETTTRESRQVVDVHKDNEKFMSPMAQLIGAESELIEITEKTQKLNREIEQQALAGDLLKEAELTLKQARSGSESVSMLAAVIADFGNKVKTDAEREKLLSLAADLSQISARFLSQAQFIAQPSVPSRPERPAPFTYIMFMGIFFAMIVGIFIWREKIITFIKKNDEII
jgi:hypothetical protein